jgi:hypothetical protein
MNIPSYNWKPFVKKWSIYSVLFTILIVGLIMLGSYLLNRYECHSSWVDSSVESKYTVRGGCLVKREEAWVPAANFRVD